jgi:cyclophilin family peptidyl-prolyl cis-trans isomerase
MPAHTHVATVHTSLGDIRINLFGFHAPVTVDNFVGLATGTKEWQDPATGETKNSPLYDGVIFHRIIKGFMCQGGDPTGTGTGGPGYRFVDELPAPGRYEVGSVAMANAGPDTNGSQFFIVSGPSGVRLPPQYSLFGKVVKGLDVLGTMESVATGPRDKPREDIVIRSVTVTEE